MINRKRFLAQSISAVGSFVLASAISAEGKDRPGQQVKYNTSKLKNVRLEVGFERDDFEVTNTKTALFMVELADGKIAAILPNEPHNLEAVDARGFLMLPAMKDMHIHLDKTYYGGPWKARSKRQKSVPDMIALEKTLLPELAEHATERAHKLIKLLQSKGSNFARSHVNIEPTSKLQSLKNLERAIALNKDTFGVETVAFPQHGVYYSNAQSWMTEAAKMGVDFIGGVDPYSLDGDIARTVDFTVQLALDYNAGIDIHLHETGQSGVDTINYLINKVQENPALKKKTFLSHAFALGKLEGAALTDMAQKLSDAQIGVASTVPIGRLLMPIPTLLAHGVQVVAGTDSVVDHWQPFGTGSMLDKANRMAELYGYSAELELSRCLAIATAGILPLDEQGQQLWPKVGDAADFNLFDVSCSAEAVARLPVVEALYHQGKPVYQKNMDV